MNEVREIVTRAVIAKGKKIFKICDTVIPSSLLVFYLWGK